jgi:hypothetical protein
MDRFYRQSCRGYSHATRREVAGPIYHLWRDLAICLFMHLGAFDPILAEGSISYEKLAGHLNADLLLVGKSGKQGSPVPFP